MEELSTANNMESEVLQGLDRQSSGGRLTAINKAANRPQSPELESGKIKMGLNEVVKNLGKETQEMFPEKEDVAETVVVSEKDGSTDEVSKEVNDKKIMGMKPIVFGVVLVLAGVGAYFAYKKFKKSK